MWDAFPLILKWLAVGLALSPLVLGLASAMVEGSILPRFIPRAEIDRLADDIMRRYPDDPEEVAYNEEYASWHRSEMYDQGKWHRVRKEIQRRLIAAVFVEE